MCEVSSKGLSYYFTVFSMVGKMTIAWKRVTWLVPPIWLHSSLILFFILGLHYVEEILLHAAGVQGTILSDSLDIYFLTCSFPYTSYFEDNFTLANIASGLFSFSIVSLHFGRKNIPYSFLPLVWLINEYLCQTIIFQGDVFMFRWFCQVSWSSAAFYIFAK